MGEKLALNVGPSRITMAYERLGNAQAPPVVLIQGVAAQLDQLARRFLRRVSRARPAADPVRQP